MSHERSDRAQWFYQDPGQLERQGEQRQQCRPRGRGGVAQRPDQPRQLSDQRSAFRKQPAQSREKGQNPYRGDGRRPAQLSYGDLVAIDPAESPEAGGRRPRQPFEKLFQMNGYDNPFPRSQQVVEELERDGMLQQPAPLPWREAELDYLKKALGIKGQGWI